MASDRGLCGCGCGTRTRKRQQDASGMVVFYAHQDQKYVWNGAGVSHKSRIVKVRKMARGKLEQRKQMSELQLLRSQLARANAEVEALRDEIRVVREQTLDEQAKFRLLQNIRAESRELRMEMTYLEQLRGPLPERVLEPVPIA